MRLPAGLLTDIRRLIEDTRQLGEEADAGITSGDYDARDMVVDAEDP